MQKKASSGSGVPPRTLPRVFFDRDPREVGRDLLGKFLVRKKGSSLLIGRIVETEAYLSSDDAASHSHTGLSARNAVMFGPPGFAYVYLSYGCHFCLNVSCLPKGEAGAVLFRAVEPVSGAVWMAKLRGFPGPPSDMRLLASGPGRLGQAFGVTRLRDNGKDLASPDSDLYLAHDDFTGFSILETPRIGITKSAHHPYRYVIAGNRFASGRKALNSEASGFKPRE